MLDSFGRLFEQQEADNKVAAGLFFIPSQLPCPVVRLQASVQCSSQAQSTDHRQVAEDLGAQRLASGLQNQASLN